MSKPRWKRQEREGGGAVVGGGGMDVVENTNGNSTVTHDSVTIRCSST